PVVIEAALVRRAHEEPVLPNKHPGQVHRLVDAVRCAIRLEAVDADLRRLVQIRRRRALSPWRRIKRWCSPPRRSHAAAILRTFWLQHAPSRRRAWSAA